MVNMYICHVKYTRFYSKQLLRQKTHKNSSNEAEKFP